MQYFSRVHTHLDSPLFYVDELLLQSFQNLRYPKSFFVNFHAFFNLPFCALAVFDFCCDFKSSSDSSLLTQDFSSCFCTAESRMPEPPRTARIYRLCGQQLINGYRRLCGGFSVGHLFCYQLSPPRGGLELRNESLFSISIRKRSLLRTDHLSVFC